MYPDDFSFRPQIEYTSEEDDQHSKPKGKLALPPPGGLLILENHNDES
jgi:hypothetical protein